ncbi:MAG TPA: hypothetical protein ENH29_08600, partial [Bacteroidetes bacterium]|nr:hypothetical protein [Bacteroidota bacterium]
MMKIKLFLLILFALRFTISVNGQLIAIKTVPLATGDQFMIFPAKYAGMGNLSIPVDDPWLDPFVNPAKGLHLNRSYLFSSPSLYRITNDYGAAETLPVSGFYRNGNWFGAASFSIQQLESNFTEQNFRTVPIRQNLSDSFSENVYLFGALGKRLANLNTSIGFSFFAANLQAMEGIELLYPNSREIKQNGSMYDFRLGLVHKMKDGQSVEAVILHNRYNMTHDLKYIDRSIIDDSWRVSSTGFRREKNSDKSRTWGVHLRYRKQIPGSNWHFGGILTGNWKSHPKIPNYELMNIPRDPGNSQAYNIGLGFAEIDQDTIVGFEFIYEPIWSSTWAVAANEISTAGGGLIPKGSRTVDNRFAFSNYILRWGISKEASLFGFQLGLQFRRISYLFEQTDYVRIIRRRQKEHWAEWTVSWGIMVNLHSFRLHYNGRILFGTGRPGITNRGIANSTL